MTDSEEQPRPKRATGFADLFESHPPAEQQNTTPESPKTLEDAKSKSKSSDFLMAIEKMGFKTGEHAFVGTTVAQKYEILSFLGKGGMSNIFKVRQIETGEILALKVLHEHLWQEADSVKRFTLEAQAVSRVSHPNIITFQDFGVTEEGQPFLVMDYLEGKTLTDAIRERDGLPLFTVMAVFEQLAEGLAEAHRMGVIHRDLKPDNVMFLSKGDDYQLKLVDFGIAKIVAEDAQTSKLTRTGEIFGSPLYMSPEQCLGDKVDHRSDIYSLGAVIYATITGDPPLYGANVLETMNKQITEMPHPVAVVRPDVAEREKDSWISLDDLEFVVMKCLQKRTWDRYQTMDELLVDIRKLSDGTAISRPSEEEARQAAEVSAKREQEASQAAREAVKAKLKNYPTFGAAPNVAASNIAVPNATAPVTAPAAVPATAPIIAPSAVPTAAPVPPQSTVEPVPLATFSAPDVVAPHAGEAKWARPTHETKLQVREEPEFKKPAIEYGADSRTASSVSIASQPALPDDKPNGRNGHATLSRSTDNLRRVTTDIQPPGSTPGRPDKFMVIAFIALLLFIGLAIALYTMSQH